MAWQGCAFRENSVTIMWSAWLDNTSVCFLQHNHYWVGTTAVNNTSHERWQFVTTTCQGSSNILVILCFN